MKPSFFRTRVKPLVLLAAVWSATWLAFGVVSQLWWASKQAPYIPFFEAVRVGASGLLVLAALGAACGVAFGLLLRRISKRPLGIIGGMRAGGLAVSGAMMVAFIAALSLGANLNSDGLWQTVGALSLGAMTGGLVIAMARTGGRKGAVLGGSEPMMVVSGGSLDDAESLGERIDRRTGARHHDRLP